MDAADMSVEKLKHGAAERAWPLSTQISNVLSNLLM
jgi:hypothetical protein